MDTTTIVVILVFVLSILSSVTDQKNQIVKHVTPKSTSGEPVQLVTSPSATTVPGPHYEHGSSEDVRDKILNFIGNYSKKISTWDSSLMADSILRFSRQYNVNPRLATALIARESSFNQFAVSSSGAQGLGQLLPATSQSMGITNPFDIEENIKGTVRYIRSCLDRFKGHSSQVPFALAGYLEGPNQVKRNNGYLPSSSGYVDDILSIYQNI